MTTQEQYLEHPNTCPHCNSDNIETGSIEFHEFGALSQDVICNDCEEQWQDNYKLTGYTAE